MEFDAKHAVIAPEGVFIIGTYDENGVPMVYSLWVEDLTHNHFVEDAEMIWKWMQNFSRDPETKAIIYSAE